MTDTSKAPEDEVHYQLYKLLAFAIQELSYFASEERVNDCLQLPRPLHTLTNRARMAVERIESQNPRFFSGYVKFRRGTLYPPEAIETTASPSVSGGRNKFKGGANHDR